MNRDRNTRIWNSFGELRIFYRRLIQRANSLQIDYNRYNVVLWFSRYNIYVMKHFCVIFYLPFFKERLTEWLRLLLWMPGISRLKDVRKQKAFTIEFWSPTKSKNLFFWIITLLNIKLKLLMLNEIFINY